MKKLLIVLLAACAVAACSQKELATDNVVSSKVFKAVIEQAPTKVYNDGLSLYWEAGDMIAVYDNCDQAAFYEFAGADGSVKGDFTLATPAASGASPIQGIYAVYPSNYANGVTDDKLGVYVYDDQTPNYLGDIDTHYGNLMVAYSEDESLSFRNIGGYLHLSLYGEGTAVSKVIVTGEGGEIISGDMLVSFDSNGLPVTEPDASSRYLYDNVYHEYSNPIALGASASDAVDFYFILPPGNYSSGINVEIVDQYDQSADFTVSSPVTIYRNKITSFPPLEVKFAAVTEYLDCGDYVITDASYPNLAIPFTLSATTDPAVFFVNLYGSVWYADYDESASTLTVSGIEKEWETMGNQFGDLYGYYDAGYTMAYGFFVFADDSSDGDDALVFDVDPATKQLTKINQEFQVPVYYLSDYSLAGYMGYASAGSAVTKKDAVFTAPSIKAAPAALKAGKVPVQRSRPERVMKLK